MISDEYVLTVLPCLVFKDFVELSVTPGPVTEWNEVRLGCSGRCSLMDNPRVMWIKNGKILPPNKQTKHGELLLQRVSTEDGDYSCALKGNDKHPSKPLKVTVTCKYSDLQQNKKYKKLCCQR